MLHLFYNLIESVFFPLDNKIILLLFGEKIEYDWVSQEIGQSKSHDCSLGTGSVEGKPENLKVICN